MPQEIPEQKSIDIIERAREDAKIMIEIARNTAELLAEKTRKETGEMIVDSIKKAFGQGEEEQKIVRLNRIPYICEDIKEIRKKQDKMMLILYLGMGGLGVISFFIPILIRYIWK